MPNNRETRPQSAFREQIARDFEEVFLNTEEFGRICLWNGTPLKIVDGASPAYREVGETVGVNAQIREIYCRRGDFFKPPAVNDMVDIDGEEWLVSDVKEPFEHYVITLSRQAP